MNFFQRHSAVKPDVVPTIPGIGSRISRTKEFTHLLPPDFKLTALDVTAKEAGLLGALSVIEEEEKICMEGLVDGARNALLMPFPSPAIGKLLAGNEVMVGGRNSLADAALIGWSMAPSRYMGHKSLWGNFRGAGFDLVMIHTVTPKQGTEPVQLRLPLSVGAELKNPDRPDRINVELGDRQLPLARTIKGRPAQELLLAGARFMEIIGQQQPALQRGVVDTPTNLDHPKVRGAIGTIY